MSIWVERIEQADNNGDTKAIFKGVKALSGATGQGASQPTMHVEEVETVNPVTGDTEKKLVARDRIASPEELADVWHKFLQKKFSQTEKEKLRAEFDALPETGEEDALTREEFEEAVKRLKNGKATGADSIPAEVWKHSSVAKSALFEFLQQV